MQPHVVLMALAGGLLALWVLSRAVSELRRHVESEGANAEPRLNGWVLLSWVPYWIIWAALGHWWPQAQIPFVVLWFGCIAFGLVVLLIVRSRRQRRS